MDKGIAIVIVILIVIAGTLSVLFGVEMISDKVDETYGPIFLTDNTIASYIR